MWCNIISKNINISNYMSHDTATWCQAREGREWEQASFLLWRWVSEINPIATVSHVPSHSVAMAKQYEVVDPNKPQTSSQGLMTDWSKVFCFRKTRQELFSVQLSPKVAHRLAAGYSTAAELLESFSTIGCMPKTLSLSRLDDCGGIEATLKLHKPKWRDSCRPIS